MPLLSLLCLNGCQWLLRVQSPHGFLQRGHSNDHRPALPHLKITLTILEPLGLPLTITTGASTTTLATRADIVAHQDRSLCPLSAKQGAAEDLERRLAPTWSGEPSLENVRFSAQGHVDTQARPTNEETYEPLIALTLDSRQSSSPGSCHPVLSKTDFLFTRTVRYP